MNKKVIKVMSVLLMIAIMLTFFSTVYAASQSAGTIIKPGEVTPIASSAQSDVLTIGQRIVGILQAIGVVVSVVILIVLGIKYMMGSAEEKADYKKTFIPYIVGAVLIFSASMIAGAVVNFISGT